MTYVNEISPELSNDQGKDDLFVIDAVTELRRKREIFCTMTINGKPLELKIDTGAKCNVLTLNLFAKLSNGGSNLQVAGRRSRVAGHCFTNRGSILNIHKS